MRKKSLLLLSFVFFVFFVFFSYLVKKDFFNQIDFDSMVKIQDKIPTKYDSFLSFFSLIAKFEVISLLLLLLIFFRRKTTSFLIFFPFLAAHLIELIGKIFLHQPGPPYMFHRYRLYFNFPSSYIQPGNAYPSGHSLRAIFIIGIIIYIILKSKIKYPFKTILTTLLVSLLLLILVSRVSLGEHWLSDVIGGIMLGLSMMFISLVFL